jgi:hypothetical protein
MSDIPVSCAQGKNFLESQPIEQTGGVAASGGEELNKHCRSMNGRKGLTGAICGSKPNSKLSSGGCQREVFKTFIATQNLGTTWEQ